MATVDEQIAALEAARAARVAALGKPERGSAIADRSVSYPPVQEHLDAIAAIDAQLATLRSRPKQFAAYARKGV